MKGRGDRLAAGLAERELALILITDLVNVSYLTGFGGTNGVCICGPDTRLFITDFRYTERAEAEVEGWEVLTLADDWLGGIAARLSGRVGFEDDRMRVRTLRQLEEKLPEGVELVPAGGAVDPADAFEPAPVPVVLGPAAVVVAAAPAVDEAGEPADPRAPAAVVVGMVGTVPDTVTTPSPMTEKS